MGYGHEQLYVLWLWQFVAGLSDADYLISIFSTLQGLLHPQQAEVGALRFRTILNILCIT